MRAQIVSLRGESGCERRGDERNPDAYRGNLLPLFGVYGKTAEGDHHVFHSAERASFIPRDDTQNIIGKDKQKMCHCEEGANAIDVAISYCCFWLMAVIMAGDYFSRKFSGS